MPVMSPAVNSMILVRHGENDSINELTIEGCKQARRLGDLLRDKIDKDWIGLVSPPAYSLQTALAITKATGINFDVKVGFHGMVRVYVYLPIMSTIFAEFDWTSMESSQYLNQESERDFEERMKTVTTLSNKVVIVTTLDCIDYIIKKVCGVTKKQTIPFGSATLIQDGRLIYAGAQ